MGFGILEINCECFKCMKHDSQIGNNEDEQGIIFLQLP
jgi:hypothetical protein